MWLVRSNKAAGGFIGFQKATSEPAGKEENLQHDIWCLKHLGKQGCNWRFHNHKRFNPRQSRSVNIRPSVLFMFNHLQFCIVISCQFITHYLFFVICHIASCFVFTFVLFKTLDIYLDPHFEYGFEFKSKRWILRRSESTTAPRCWWVCVVVARQVLMSVYGRG